MKALLDDYELAGIIGSGNFSQVIRAIHKDTCANVGIKIIRKTASPGQESIDFTKLGREADALKQLNHPNAPTLFQIEEDQTMLCLVMEFIEGDSLLTRINRNGAISEFQSKLLFSQLVSVVSYLHKKLKIVHRDLKCENVLVDVCGRVTLIDFGFCNVMKEDNSLFETKCGSPAYASPELVRGENYSSQTDIWSLGVILYAMLSGHLPFSGASVVQVLRDIVETDPPELPEALSPVVCSLVAQMLQKDPESRITIDGVMQHEWFSDIEIQEFEEETPDFAEIARMVAAYDSEMTEEKIAAGFRNRVFDRSMAMPRLLAVRSGLKSSSKLRKFATMKKQKSIRPSPIPLNMRLHGNAQTLPLNKPTFGAKRRYTLGLVKSLIFKPDKSAKVPIDTLYK